MSKRPSIRDIARKAGLAPITVSRVYSEPGLVSPKTRALVLSIANKLGYVHGRRPPQLGNRLNRLIGIVIPGLHLSFFSEFIAGAEEVADTHGYDVLIGISNGDEKTEETTIRSMLSRSADGLINLGELSGPAKQLLHRQKKWIRIVEAWGMVEHPIDFMVALNNEAVGDMAAKHFFQRGYRKLAFAGSLISRDGERWQGFRKAVVELLSVEPVLLDMTPSVEDESEEYYLHCGARILDKLSDRVEPVDALFCAIDEIAHGVMFDAVRRGICIPDNLALCGCGDRPYASVVEPPLTTIAIPGYDLGRRSAEMLLAGITDNIPSEKFVFTPKLVIRRSS